MTEHDIFQTVRNVTLEVLPFLSADDVTIDKSLKDLGANSIDRAEVVTISMEKLGVKIAMLEFGKAKNLRDLVGVLKTFL